MQIKDLTARVALYKQTQCMGGGAGEEKWLGVLGVLSTKSKCGRSSNPPHKRVLVEVPEYYFSGVLPLLPPMKRTLNGVP